MVLVNRQRVVLVTPPIAEPVTLDQAKVYLGQDLNHHDELIRSLISAARGALETTYGVVFMPQTFDQASTWFSTVDEPPLRFLRVPVQDVLSVTYVDQAGVQRAVPVAQLLSTRAGLRFALPDGLTYPSAYVVRYVAGYGRQSSALVDFTPAPRTITRAAGSWLDDGYLVGDVVYTSSTKPSNRGPLTISALDAQTMTVVESLSNESDVDVLMASATGIPEALRIGLLSYVAWLYEHRGDDPGPAPVPSHVERLVAIYGVSTSP